MHLLNDTNKQSLNIYLQSQNADVSLGESNKIFYLNEHVNAQPGERLLIGLTGFECPYSFYNINTDINDSISFSTSSGNYTLTLDAKNYDAEYLAEVITLALAAEEPTLGGIISLEFDEYTNKYTFSSTVAFTVTESTLDTELGLDSDNYPTDETTYECPNVLNLGGVSNIYVRLTNLGLRNLDSRGQISNIVATIPVNVEPTYYIYYTPPEYLYFMTNENMFNFVHIELTDDDGNEIVLNGGKFTLTLTVHYQYQRDEKVLNKYVLNDKKSVPMDEYVKNLNLKNGK